MSVNPYQQTLKNTMSATAYFLFKNLVFAQLKNLGQLKCIFDKFSQKLKWLPFYGEWAQKLQIFR